MSLEMISDRLAIATDASLGLYDLTPQLRQRVQESGIQNGQLLLFNRHTTTALLINEYEPRLLEDLRNQLRHLAPATAYYRHNDLARRPEVPPEEPINAHSHLQAIALSNHEVIPIVAGQLELGRFQSVIFVELDGPKDRQISLQIWGQR